jgi:N-terminal domain of (some) glycogen debranching enzymes
MMADQKLLTRTLPEFASTRPSGATVTLVEGSTFCITQTSDITQTGGDILLGGSRGLFVQDTRVLSRWSLTIDGRPADPLAVQQARAGASPGVLRGNGGPGQAADTLPGHGHPWGGS